MVPFFCIENSSKKFSFSLPMQVSAYTIFSPGSIRKSGWAVKKPGALYAVEPVMPVP
jgi:hypothetical protein